LLYDEANAFTLLIPVKRLFNIYLDAYRGLSRASWMLAIVMLINRTGSMVLPFLGVYMVDHLHFTIAQSGFVLSFFGLGSVAGSFIGGYLTDKTGEFNVQVYSLFANAVMFCLIPYFTTVPSLAAIIFLQALIGEQFRPANSVAVAKYARPENITRAFSLNRMAINLGFSLGPALGGILAAVSYSLLFYANAAAALIAGITYIIFFRRRHLIFKRKSAAKKATMHKEQIIKRSPYLDLKFIVFCLFCAAFSVCFMLLLNTLPLFYKEAVKLDQKMIGILLGYSGLVVVLLEMLLVHYAERKMSIMVTMALGTVLCSLSYGMLAFDPVLPLLFVSITLLSCGEILIFPFIATITARSAGENNKGSYMGMNGIALSIAFIFSPLLGSGIASRFGFNVLWISTAVVLMLTAAGFYFSIGWLLRDKPEEKL